MDMESSHDLGIEELEELTRKFQAIYWGSSILVDDEAVEAAMIAFFQEVRDFRQGLSDRERLKVKADRLVRASRASSEATWRSFMPDLSE